MSGGGIGSGGITDIFIPPNGASGYVLTKLSAADYDFGWIAGGGGGGGSPVGPSAAVQFNTAGAFDGTSDFIYDKAQRNLIVTYPGSSILALASISAQSNGAALSLNTTGTGWPGANFWPGELAGAHTILFSDADVFFIATALSGPVMEVDAINNNNTIFQGTLAAANLTGTNTGDKTITLTGDVTGSGMSTFAATLATVNSNVGTFTHATVTADAKGRITAISSGTTPPPTTSQYILSAVDAALPNSRVVTNTTEVTWDTTTAGQLKANVGAIAESKVTNLTTDLAARVLSTRLINTTAPLTGGGDLSADRTLAITDFVASGASHARGAVPDPGAVAGATKFLREDATWATPPGGGGGNTATAVVVTAPYTGAQAITVTVTDAAISSTSKILLGWGAVLDTDDNTPEMDMVSFFAIPSTGSMALTLSGPSLGGNYRLNYQVAA